MSAALQAGEREWGSAILKGKKREGMMDDTARSAAPDNTTDECAMGASAYARVETWGLNVINGISSLLLSRSLTGLQNLPTP